MLEPSPLRDGERRTIGFMGKRVVAGYKQHTDVRTERLCWLVKLPSTESYSTFLTTELYEGGPNLLDGGGAVLRYRNMYLHGKLCSSQCGFLSSKS